MNIDLDLSAAYGPRGIIAFDAIPQAMQEMTAWIMWREEPRADGTGKTRLTKVPYTIDKGRASSTNPETWATFDQVRAAYQVGGWFSGIGFVFIEGSGFVGIDLDHHLTAGDRDSGGNDGAGRELSAMAKGIVEQLHSYTEVSPSGTGLHIVCKGDIPQSGKRKDELGIEMYKHGRYFTVTGDRWPGTPDKCEDRTPEMQALWRTVWPGSMGEAVLPKKGGAGGAGGGSNADWLAAKQAIRGLRIISTSRANDLEKGNWQKYYAAGGAVGGGNQSAADFALCLYWAAQNMPFDEIDKKFRTSGLYRKKWDTEHYSDGYTYGERTIEKAVEIVKAHAEEISWTIGTGTPPDFLIDGSDLFGEGTVSDGDGDGEVSTLHLDAGALTGTLAITVHKNGVATGADAGADGAADVVDGGALWDDADESTDEADDVDLGAGGGGSVGGGGGIATTDPAALPETDLGNAERLVLRHADKYGTGTGVGDFGDTIRYVHGGIDNWIVWNGGRWEMDGTGQIDRLAHHTVREMYKEAAALPQQTQRVARSAWAEKSEGQARVAAMVKMAQNLEGVVVHQEQLDGDPWLLNVVNGTIDLRTGEMREHRRDDFITNRSPLVYDPDIDISEWMNFLMWACEGDAETAHFMQLAAGYSCTGDISEEVLFFLYGLSGSGKSTFITAIRQALGPGYVRTMNFDTLLDRTAKKGGVRDDIADLVGSRMVTSIEVSEGERLAEGIIKNLTGGDVAKARFLYKKLFEFLPTFKLWLVANDAPKLRGDPAMWRRIVRIPMNAQPLLGADPSVKRRMNSQEMGMQVLAWLIRGARDWYTNGLIIPTRVRESTEAYKDEVDDLGEFLHSRCVIEDGMDGLGRGAGKASYAAAKYLNDKQHMKATGGRLYEAYKAYGVEIGMSQREMMTATMFGRKMSDRFIKVVNSRGVWYIGISVIDNED